MTAQHEAADERQPSPRAGLLAHVSLARAIAAALLLAGLFALLFLVLLPRGGGDGSVLAADLVDTQPGSGENSVGVHPGNLARDFEASDLEELRFRLSDLRGRPVVINFWATWCASCLAEMPVLEQQRLAHQEEGLAIVAVNVGEGLGDARRFIDDLGLSEFTIAMDPDLTVSDAYSVRGLPHSVFIDSNGVIEAEYQGQLDDDTMERYVSAAIAAAPGGEAPSRLRLVTTVPRENVLEVLPDVDDPALVLFRSRRFRCDDSYCAQSVADGLSNVAGVMDVELRADEAPAELAVSFDAGLLDLDDLVAVVADALRALADPLYTRELEVRF